MSHAINADPVLVGSAYWGGVDIANPESFRGVEQPHLHLSDEQHRIAAELLQAALDATILGQSDETILSEQEIVAVAEKSSDQAAVLVINSEFLIQWDPDRLNDRRVVEEELSVPDTDWSAIHRPFTKYWLEHQSTESRDDHYRIGRESAYFPDESSFYYRALQWAILVIREKDKVPVLDTWSFNSPRIIHNGESIVPLTKQRTAGLPLNVGEIVPDPPMSQQHSPRSMHRIIDLTLVHGQHPGGDRSGQPDRNLVMT